MKDKLLLAVLLTAPMCCWAQEPASSRLVLDLANPSIKKILRDTVANPARAVESIDEAAPGIVATELPAFGSTTVNLTAFKGPPAPLPPPVAVPQSDGLLSAIINELLDDPVDTDAERYDEWLSAQSRDNLLTTQQRYEKQQRALTGHTPLTDPSTYIPERKRR